METCLRFQAPSEHPAHPVRVPPWIPPLDFDPRSAFRFFNKADLLKEKLESGVRFDKYVPNYGDRPNDVTSVISCEVLQMFNPVYRSPLSPPCSLGPAVHGYPPKLWKQTGL